MAKLVGGDGRIVIDTAEAAVDKGHIEKAMACIERAMGLLKHELIDTQSFQGAAYTVLNLQLQDILNVHLKEIYGNEGKGCVGLHNSITTTVATYQDMEQMLALGMHIE